MPIKNKTINAISIERYIPAILGCLSLSKNNGNTIMLITIKVKKGARKPSKKLLFFQIRTPDIPRITHIASTITISHSPLYFLLIFLMLIP